jgi:hypothetical protein
MHFFHFSIAEKQGGAGIARAIRLLLDGVV